MRIFGRKWDQVTRGWRKLHKEELNNMYSSPGITTMIKSRRMRLAGHVAQVGKRLILIGHSCESQKLG
jgi:hypothetical protein